MTSSPTEVTLKNGVIQMGREMVKTKTIGIKTRTETLGAEENLTNHIFGLHPHHHPQH